MELIGITVVVGSIAYLLLVGPLLHGLCRAMQEDSKSKNT